MRSALLRARGKGSAADDGRRSGWWNAFTDWRRSRPFWAGVWTLLAGVEILSIPFAPLPIMMHEGIAGVAGSLMGIFMVVLALSLWLAPGHRVFAGIATLVFAVASLVLSNFGGFLIGFLLGIAGGAMAVSWVPYPRPPAQPPIWPDWRRGNGSDGSGGPADAGDPAAPTDPGDPDGPDGPGGPGGPGGGGGPGGAGGGGGPGGPGGSGEPGNGGGGDGDQAADGGQGGGNSRTKPLTWRTTRLRALGVLPIGALLTGGLQAAPAHHARTVSNIADAPLGVTGMPGGTADEDTNTPQGLTVCSLLGGLLAGKAPATPGTGNRNPEDAEPDAPQDGPDAPRTGPEHAHHPTGSATAESGPQGSHTSRAPRVPKPRGEAHGTHTAGRGSDTVKPAPAPTRSSGGGLLGSVAGLLGLDGAPDAHDTPRKHGNSPAARHDRATPSPSSSDGPLRRRKADHSSGVGASHEDPARSGDNTRDAVPPSDLSLHIPRLPGDGRMDGPLSLLPLHIKLDVGSGGGASSPWCLPQPLISLRLGVDAAAYQVPAAAQPFRVRSPLMVLTGLTYHGITEVPTAYGPQEVLVFTVTRLDIESLRETAPLLAPRCGRNQPPPPAPPFHGLPGLRLPLLDMGIPGIGSVDPTAPGPWYPCQGTLETDGAPSSTTVATGQPVVLLTKVLSGNLLGLLPVTFTPSMPPPLPPGLTLPIPIFFTNVTAYNQYLSADDLDVPGLHQTASR